jgi:D-3-phosphoglycerate dehydrogenase
MEPIVIAFGMDESLIPSVEQSFSSAEVRVLPLGRVLESAVLREACYVLWVGLTPYVNEALLNSLPNLRIVASSTTGHTHLDLELIENRRIKLVTLAGESDFLEGITATPELAWGLVLDVWRNISLSQQKSEIDLSNRQLYQSTQLKGKRIGIIGFGRVGKRVAQYAQAFELEICAFDKRDVVLPLGVAMVSIESLLSNSDIVLISASVHQEDIPHYPIIGKNELALMKRTAIIINIARGVLVDESALAAAINDGEIYGVGTDVQRNEEISKHGFGEKNPLNLARLDGKNVVLTPHIGGMCADALDQCNKFIAHKIQFALGF